eukprot:gene21034-biopygen1755
MLLAGACQQRGLGVVRVTSPTSGEVTDARDRQLRFQLDSGPEYLPRRL